MLNVVHKKSTRPRDHLLLREMQEKEKEIRKRNKRQEEGQRKE